MPLFDPAALSRQALLTQLDDPNAAPLKAESGIGIAPYAAMAGGSAFDLGTTVDALQRPGTREANPLLSHGGTAGLVATKAATTAALLWAMHELAKAHPTAAKVMGYVGGGTLTGLGLHNLQQGR